MQVIYFLLALAKFQWLFELISVTVVCLSTCVTFVYASFCIAFAEWKWCKHLRDNGNSAFQYSFKLHQISSRRSPSSKSNKWAITISVYFFNIWHTYLWAKKNKTCLTKTWFTNFTRRNCFLHVWTNLFIVLKIRSHAKLTCIFVNCDATRKSLRVVSLSASSLVVCCL